VSTGLDEHISRNRTAVWLRRPMGDNDEVVLEYSGADERAFSLVFGAYCAR